MSNQNLSSIFKKAILFALFLYIFLPKATFALEMNATTSPLKMSFEERKEFINQKQENLKIYISEFKNKIKLSEEKSKRVERWVVVVFVKFDNALEKIESSLNNIENIISVVDSNFDLSIAKTKLEEAKNATEEARIESLASKQVIIDNLNSKISKEEIKTLIKSVKDKIKNSHSKAIEALVALKKEINQSNKK
jgi:hypothetical protein